MGYRSLAPSILGEVRALPSHPPVPDPQVDGRRSHGCRTPLLRSCFRRGAVEVRTLVQHRGVAGVRCRCEETESTQRERSRRCIGRVGSSLKFIDGKQPCAPITHATRTEATAIEPRRKGLGFCGDGQEGRCGAYHPGAILRLVRATPNSGRGLEAVQCRTERSHCGAEARNTRQHRPSAGLDS